MKLLKSVWCMVVGHKRLEAFKDATRAPFEAGIKNESFPMFPCGRCDSMYIEKTETHKCC